MNFESFTTELLLQQFTTTRLGIYYMF